MVHKYGSTNLQVDLLSEGGLIGKGSIHRLLEGEGEDGGDPGVPRGTQLWKSLQDGSQKS